MQYALSNAEGMLSIKLSNPDPEEYYTTYRAMPSEVLADRGGRGLAGLQFVGRSRSRTHVAIDSSPVSRPSPIHTGRDLS
ncbi:hypothetical protein TNCV_4046431 [Trichonephila clavipes]|nr:hypothetical protein TNCV_4046431 [Trichonephila clavipes]